MGKAFLKLGVKSITTTGFAGGPGIGKPNDLSIPGQFFLNDKKIDVNNFISKESTTGLVEPNTKVHFGTAHSHSFSPAEQTQQYVTDYIDKGYETVDVEQTLVAERVAGHNRRTGQKVRFGSIGLITDVPRSLRSNIDSVEGLDHFDQRQRARSINDGAMLYENAIFDIETQGSLRARAPRSSHILRNCLQNVLRSLLS